MSNVWILGTSGMLGAAYVEVFAESPHKITKFARKRSTDSSEILPIDIELELKTLRENFLSIAKNQLKPDFILNAIGVVKPRIDSSLIQISNSYKVNSVFPIFLDSLAKDLNAVVLQIGTDCVYSGQTGKYLESSFHDAQDHYGVSKSYGEIESTSTYLIRSSIVGQEKFNKYSLVSWIESNSKFSKLNGYTNHFWNGVTTRTFAKIMRGIVDNNFELKGKQHLVPANDVDKFNLVKLISNKISRTDLEILKSEANESIDRTLRTTNQDINKILWELGSYRDIPSVEELITQDL